MVNKITIGVKGGERRTILYDLGPQLPPLEIEPGEARKIDRILGHLKRNQRAYTAMATALALLLDPTGAFAAGGMSGGMRIIILMQKAAFWLGLAITIWGIVEAQLDFPGWKGRILKGVLGYVGILLLPLLFLELQNSLQADVWQQIQEGGVAP